MRDKPEVDAAKGNLPWAEDDGKGPAGSAVRERNVGSDELGDVPKKGEKVTWQFKYRRYRHVLPFEDPAGEAMPSGRKPNSVVFARNWRRELDLSDKHDARIHKALLADPQCGVDFTLLTNVRKTDTISERAETLRKLDGMTPLQLSSMLTKDEKVAAGLLPNCIDKMHLIMAIIDTKKLSTKEE
jgi:hypothetical protein